jgi:hypothetical protein
MTGASLPAMGLGCLPQQVVPRIAPPMSDASLLATKAAACGREILIQIARRRLKRSASAGIDGETVATYEQELQL